MRRLLWPLFAAGLALIGTGVIAPGQVDRLVSHRTVTVIGLALVTWSLAGLMVVQWYGPGSPLGSTAHADRGWFRRRLHGLYRALLGVVVTLWLGMCVLVVPWLAMRIAGG
jgi:hypothetical protein